MQMHSEAFIFFNQSSFSMAQVYLKMPPSGLEWLELLNSWSGERGTALQSISKTAGFMDKVWTRYVNWFKNAVVALVLTNPTNKVW